MVTRADGIGIRPVASIEATQRVASVADARHQSQAFDQFTSANFGKLFKAEVLSSLTDGSFTVKLEDATTLQMNLPPGTRVGEKLELTLIATQPRPTFSMPQPGNAASSGPQLSQAGQLIGNLLRTAEAEGAPATLVGKAAVVTSPAASPTQVATALKDTLTYSGLFYESHVSQWATGSRPLSELMREPQARFSNPRLLAAMQQQAVPVPPSGTSGTQALPGSAPSTAANLAADTPDLATSTPAGTAFPTASPDADAPPGTAARLQAYAAAATVTDLPDGESGGKPGALPAATLPHPGPDATTESLPQTAQQSAPSAASLVVPVNVSTTDDAAPDNPKLAVDSASISLSADTPSSQPEAVQSETARMVSLQLDALEHQRIMWRGEIWPGQPMEWEVLEDDSGGHGDGGDAERSWQSTLRMELPSLGTIAATIRLTGQHVQVQVRAANEHTAALLRTHGDKLATAMEAAGSPLDLLTVKQDSTP